MSAGGASEGSGEQDASSKRNVRITGKATEREGPRDKALLELDLLKEGNRKTEVIPLTQEQAAVIAEKGDCIMKRPDGAEHQAPVDVE